MVYYKLTLNDKRITKENTFPVVIRITYNKNNTTITTGVRVKKEHWDSKSQQVNKSNPNFQTLNKSIIEIFIKVQKAIHVLVDEDAFSFEALKAKLAKPLVTEAKTLNFYEFSNRLITEMIELNQTGNALVYRVALNRFISYCGNNKIGFKEIDYNLLNGFKRNLQLNGIKQNTISNYLRTIKAIYNKAIKAKIIDRSFYPFYDISVKQEKTSNRAISMDQIKDFVSYKLVGNTSEWHARNYFMISFLLIGASFTDLAYLKTDNIKAGRVIFKRRKTHKQYSIKLLPETSELFSYYQNSNSKYLLPILPSNVKEDSIEAKKLISQWIKTTNKYLKRIGTEVGLDSPLTSYVARHTWATTAKRLGYSNELIAEAMGHEYGNRTTAIYLDSFDQDVIDEMNKSVFSSII